LLLRQLRFNRRSSRVVCRSKIKTPASRRLIDKYRATIDDESESSGTDGEKLNDPIEMEIATGQTLNDRVPLTMTKRDPFAISAFAEFLPSTSLKFRQVLL